MTILKEGFPFILVPLTAGLLLIILPPLAGAIFPLVWAARGLGGLGLLFALFCAFFFRDPPIAVTRGGNIILSPCNGTVLEVEEKEDGKILRVFLSIFNVHLQRSPLAGKVVQVEHRDGKFLAAWHPAAHSLNEQNRITLETAAGKVEVRQIAGFLARRCVAWVRAGDELKAGDKIGLIKFSSQVDLYLPPQTDIVVKAGDKVRAGVTVVGKLR